MEQQSLNTIIIDSDTEKRMRLKQATASLAMFKAAQQATSPAEVLSKFEFGPPLDIVFLATRISESAIKEFIAAAKSEKNTKDAAFILVIDGKATEDQSALPNYLLLGIDGFLIEPYSVDRLIEASKLAAKVKVDRGNQRKRAAVEMMIQDLSNALSAASGFRAAGHASARVEEHLKKVGEMLQGLDAESQAYFHERLTEVWSEMQRPLKVVEFPKYQGASQRVKKVFEEKVLKQLEEMKAKKPV